MASALLWMFDNPENVAFLPPAYESESCESAARCDMVNSTLQQGVTLCLVQKLPEVNLVQPGVNLGCEFVDGPTTH